MLDVRHFVPGISPDITVYTGSAGGKPTRGKKEDKARSERNDPRDSVLTVSGAAMPLSNRQSGSSSSNTYRTGDYNRSRSAGAPDTGRNLHSYRPPPGLPASRREISALNPPITQSSTHGYNDQLHEPRPPSAPHPGRHQTYAIPDERDRTHELIRDSGNQRNTVISQPGVSTHRPTSSLHSDEINPDIPMENLGEDKISTTLGYHPDHFADPSHAASAQSNKYADPRHQVSNQGGLGSSYNQCVVDSWTHNEQPSDFNKTQSTAEELCKIRETSHRGFELHPTGSSAGADNNDEHRMDVNQDVNRTDVNKSLPIAKPRNTDTNKMTGNVTELADGSWTLISGTSLSAFQKETLSSEKSSAVRNRVRRSVSVPISPEQDAEKMEFKETNPSHPRRGSYGAFNVNEAELDDINSLERSGDGYNESNTGIEYRPNDQANPVRGENMVNTGVEPMECSYETDLSNREISEPTITDPNIDLNLNNPSLDDLGLANQSLTEDNFSDDDNDNNASIPTSPTLTSSRLNAGEQSLRVVERNSEIELITESPVFRSTQVADNLNTNRSQQVPVPPGQLAINLDDSTNDNYITPSDYAQSELQGVFQTKTAKDLSRKIPDNVNLPFSILGKESKKSEQAEASLSSSNFSKEDHSDSSKALLLSLSSQSSPLLRDQTQTHNCSPEQVAGRDEDDDLTGRRKEEGQDLSNRGKQKNKIVLNKPEDAVRIDAVSKQEQPPPLLQHQQAPSKLHSTSAAIQKATDSRSSRSNPEAPKDNQLDVEIPLERGILLGDLVSFNLSSWNNKIVNGYVRWIGRSPSSKKDKHFIAIEVITQLKGEDLAACTDGTWQFKSSTYRLCHSEKKNVIVRKFGTNIWLTHQTLQMSIWQHIDDAMHDRVVRYSDHVYYNGTENIYYKEHEPQMVPHIDAEGFEVNSVVKFIDRLPFGKLKWIGHVDETDSLYGIMEVFNPDECGGRSLTDGIYMYPVVDGPRVWLAVSNEHNLLLRPIKRFRIIEPPPLKPSAPDEKKLFPAVDDFTTEQRDVTLSNVQDVQRLDIEVPLYHHDTDILLGDRVKFPINDADCNLYCGGIVKWIGRSPINTTQFMIAIALTDEMDINKAKCTDGLWTFGNTTYRLCESLRSNVVVCDFGRQVLRDTSALDVNHQIRRHIQETKFHTLYNGQIHYNGSEKFYFRERNPEMRHCVEEFGREKDTILQLGEEVGKEMGMLKWTGTMDGTEKCYGVLEMFDPEDSKFTLTDGIYINEGKRRIWLSISDKPNLLIREIETFRKAIEPSPVKPPDNSFPNNENNQFDQPEPMDIDRGEVPSVDHYVSQTAEDSLKNPHEHAARNPSQTSQIPTVKSTSSREVQKAAESDDISRKLKERRAAILKGGDFKPVKTEIKHETDWQNASEISTAKREYHISKPVQQHGNARNPAPSSQEKSSRFYIDSEDNGITSHLQEENRLDVELPVARGILLNDSVVYEKSTYEKFPGIVRWIGRYPENPTKFMAAVQLKQNAHIKKAGNCTSGEWRFGKSVYNLYDSSEKNILVCELDKLKRPISSKAREESVDLRFAISEVNKRPLKDLMYNGCNGFYYKEHHPAKLPPTNCDVSIGDYVKLGKEAGRLMWAGPVNVKGQEKWYGVMEVDDMVRSKYVLTDGIYISGKNDTRVWLAVSDEPNLASRELCVFRTLDDKSLLPKKDEVIIPVANVSAGSPSVQEEEFVQQTLNVEIPIKSDILLNDPVQLYENIYGYITPIHGIARWIGRFPTDHQYSIAIALSDDREVHARTDECTNGTWSYRSVTYRLCDSSFKNIIVRSLNDEVYRTKQEEHYDPKSRLRHYLRYANNRRLFSKEILYNGGAGYYYKDTKPEKIVSIPGPGLGLETVVVIPLHDERFYNESFHNDPLEEYGTLKWTGLLPSGDEDKWYGIVEAFEDDSKQHILTDGIYVNQNGERIWLYISDKPNLLIRELESLREIGGSDVKPKDGATSLEGVSIEGYIIPKPFDRKRHLGADKGVEGDHNSCYMDATLYCMFSFSTAFDEMLLRDHRDDIPDFDRIQNILKNKIVNPMRCDGIIRAAGVHEFREMLDGLGKVQGLQSEEKDPEELINLLLLNVFDIPYYLELSNSQSCHTFHLLADADSAIKFPSIQKLVEYTCNQDKLQFVKMPKCLILQVPRFGKEFKMYEYIYPCDTLDLTDLLQKGERKCYICGKAAEIECEDCFKEYKELMKGTFCEECSHMTHRKPANKNHTRQKRIQGIPTASKFEARSQLKLSAVLCIERSHYVSYVRTSLEGGTWLFLDSMSDRVAEQNIPEVKELPHLDLSRDWYVRGEWQKGDKYKDVKNLHHLTRRLFKDVYACIYVNPEASQYG